LIVSLAETARRNAYPDAHREDALGCGDHLSWVPRHGIPLLFLSKMPPSLRPAPRSLGRDRGLSQRNRAGRKATRITLIGSVPSNDPPCRLYTGNGYVLLIAKVVRDKFAVCFKGDKDAEEKLDVIFEAAGVAMLGLGGRKNSKAVVCLGETAENGKSTLLDAIKGAMPKGSVSHVAAKDFKDKNEVAQLRGKSLNMSAEAGDAIGSE
jgi:hypothetical protein